MPKVMHNLVVLMDPSEDAWQTSVKAGKMILNRFCVAEDDAFELSGVYNFRKSSRKIVGGDESLGPVESFFVRKRRVKGKEH